MAIGKVEICGVDTSTLPVISNERMRELFPRVHSGDEAAREEFIRGNEWPMGKVMNCLRLALVGASSGLGIADIVTIIGKEEFASRIDKIKAALC